MGLGVSTDFQAVPSQCMEAGWGYRSPDMRVPGPVERLPTAQTSWVATKARSSVSCGSRVVVQWVPSRCRAIRSPSSVQMSSGLLASKSRILPGGGFRTADQWAPSHCAQDFAPVSRLPVCGRSQSVSSSTSSSMGG